MFGLKKWFLGGMLIAVITSLPLFAAHAMNKVYFKPAAFEQHEDMGDATITIKRSVDELEDLIKTVTVEFATNDGTATTANNDYTAVATTTVTFLPFTFTQTVPITITGDPYLEANETVILTLLNPMEAKPMEDYVSNPSILEEVPLSTVLTIKNDDEISNCGNSFVEINEGCDDGNTDAGDGCNEICQTEFCGDGSINNNAIDGTEQCDDGNTANGDCCNEECQFEDSGSPCDNPGTCSLTDKCDGAGLCTAPDATCGNGTLEELCGEQCDDNNLVNGDVCSATCQTEFCGDGSINNNGLEQCDDGNTKDSDGCSPTCKIELCGDGVVNDNGDELCDDGNAANGDGCSATCQVEFCGDGSVNNNGTEQCDDGNLTDGDGCDKNCAQEAAAEEAPAEEIPAGDASLDASPAGGGCSLIRR